MYRSRSCRAVWRSVRSMHSMGRWQLSTVLWTTPPLPGDVMQIMMPALLLLPAEATLQLGQRRQRRGRGKRAPLIQKSKGQGRKAAPVLFTWVQTQQREVGRVPPWGKLWQQCSVRSRKAGG